MNSTLLESCKSTFYACTQDLPLLNVTEYFETNCTEPFDNCMRQLLSVNAPWPQECYQATSSLPPICKQNAILPGRLPSALCRDLMLMISAIPDKNKTYRALNRYFNYFTSTFFHRES